MTLVQFLSGWMVRSSILILSGVVLVRLLRVKSPSIRLAAWIAVLAGSFAIPFLHAVLPEMPIEVGLASAGPRASLVAVAAPHRHYPLRVPQTDPEAASAPLPLVSARPFDWMRLTATLYAFAVGLLLLRLGLGIALSIRVFRRSSPTGLDAGGTQVRESDHVASPVTIGVFRPAILLPLDWRGWDLAKLDTVLAHERSHISRLDPAVQLLSAIHRALLWANPLSWFLHRTIVRAAEEVSDGDAIAATADRVSYAEILFEFMQRGVGRAGWLGVPMALYDRPERRIRRILNSAAVTRRLTGRSVAVIVVLAAPLAWLAAAAQTQSAPQPVPVPAPIVFASSQAVLPAPLPVSKSVPTLAQAVLPQSPAGPKPVPESRPAETQRPQAQWSFEVASVKPAPPATRANQYANLYYKVDDSRADMGSVSLDELVRTAYHDPWELVAPEWLAQQTFDLHATFPPGATKNQLPEMLQTFLADRFGLKIHHEERTVPVYAMAVAKDGPKFQESPPGDDVDAGACNGGFRKQCHQMTMEIFARILSMPSRMVAIDPAFLNRPGALDRPVVDMTGLTGKYTFEYVAGRVGGGRGAPVDPNAEIVTAFDGLKALGLKLDATKHTFDIIVVDHIERVPTEN